jgi:hypothetical protein
MGAGAALILLVALQTGRLAKRNDSQALLDGLRWVTVGLFVLSPAQFPWYFTWVIPLTCFRPGLAWALLPGLLTLYYTYFWIDYHIAPIAESPEARSLWGRLLLVQYLLFYAALAWAWTRERWAPQNEKERTCVSQ